MLLHSECGLRDVGIFFFSAQWLTSEFSIFLSCVWDLGPSLFPMDFRSIHTAMDGYLSLRWTVSILYKIKLLWSLILDYVFVFHD